MEHASSEAGLLRDPRDRLIIALDTPSLDAAREIAGRLEGAVRWFKVGSELYTAAGPAALEALRGAALRLAQLAQAAGLHGVVASPLDAAAIRSACGPGFLIVCPGIRPTGAGQDDQRRVLAPREAIAAGADMLVVGRPVTGASDPRRAVEEMLREISPR